MLIPHAKAAGTDTNVVENVEECPGFLDSWILFFQPDPNQKVIEVYFGPTPIPHPVLMEISSVLFCVILLTNQPTDSNKFKHIH